ncbi:MalY/PatB family protein [Parapedobacter indicus]|uniref:cysteine-S-conjugate beta-lyase n=1 Tax=Parapedobacter indicus TaxID=1477437 RepID=A0A1I3TME0_9SPHI|nr:MalY/PatB family protein [Parapedobacter indicus]PPK99340.1 cystathionine beta-lyase [Parapedobacter indicus]SFJ72378.1 cystathione beta-lyase [Parapedobacter indicus]
MDYHFDQPVDRKHTDCIKWDATGPDVLPMWIADMDFKAAPVIQQALEDRVAHGIFGYTQTPQRFYDAILGWWKKRHGFAVHPDWLIPVTGVIPALSALIRALTAPGDKILLQPPVYNHFFASIAHCDRQAVQNNLRLYNGVYHLDYDDLENKAADPAVKLLLLSNPHNPVGRVWTAEELLRIGEICLRHHVVVVSDEIHSDLVYDPHRHTPFASLGHDYALQSITVSSPSKTFNIAGLQAAYLFSENDVFRKHVRHILEMQEMALLNPFAIEALIAAYEHGEDWLESLKTYLAANFTYLTDFCRTHLPQVDVIPLQATYLVWLDGRSVIPSAADFTDRLLHEQQLWLSPGTLYGDAGEGFLRVNIACPRILLEEGLTRLVKAF